MREIGQKCKPAVVRNNLKSVKNQTEKLMDKLNKLDMNSRLILEGECEHSVSELFSQLFGVYQCIEKACKRADEYPKKGRLVEYHMRQLVESLAYSVESTLDVKPTTTKNGVLGQTVSVAVTAITGMDADGVHALIEKTLKGMK